MYKVVVVEDEKRVRQGIVMGTDWSGINCIVMGEASVSYTHLTLPTILRV